MKKKLFTLILLLVMTPTLNACLTKKKIKKEQLEVETRDNSDSVDGEPLEDRVDDQKEHKNIKDNETGEFLEPEDDNQVETRDEKNDGDDKPEMKR